MIIRECTVFDLEVAPNVKDLLEEYASECSINGLPHPSAEWETYKKLEELGVIHIFGSFADDLLTGFIVVLTRVFPHYGQKITISESFFVAKNYRKSGVGLKLRKAAEDHAKQLSSLGLLISAPFGGALASVLEADKNYTETNRVFFRKINYE